MLNRRQKFGKTGEDLAETYLKQKGFTILERNYRTKIGEIDIIAKENTTVVFIEVKARSSSAYGSPKSAVDYRKQKKISMIASQYLKQNRTRNQRSRFDVVSVKQAPNEPAEIEHVVNAFQFVAQAN